MNLRGLDPKVRRKFKAWCKKVKVSMTGAVEEFLRRAPTPGFVTGDMIDRIRSTMKKRGRPRKDQEKP